MLEFQEKKKLRNILYSKITLIAIFVLLVFVVRATFSIYYKQKVSGENLSKAREEITELEKREKMLNSEIDRLKTKFMVGKAGEEVIVIVDDNKTNKNGADASDEKKSAWVRFLDLFR